MTPENNKNSSEAQIDISKNKHYIEEWFNDFWEYEVQKNDWTETLYSILPELLNRNIEIKDRAILRSIFYNNIDRFNWIKKWDKIEINMIDNNSYEIKIWENYYIVNINNNSFIEVWWDIFLEEENIFDLTSEEIEMLINAIKIETNKAEIWLFAWKRDVYTIKVMDFIEWNLPTTAEPIDLLVDIDPNKVILETRKIIESWDISYIDKIQIRQLTINWDENIDSKTSKKILEEFKWFVVWLIKGEEFKVYREISSTN